MGTRVLNILTRMNVGGPARMVEGMLQGLPDRFDQRFLVGSVDEGEEDYRELHGLYDRRLVAIPELRRPIKPGSDAVALARILKQIRTFKPDIVHTHTAKAGILGRVAAAALRVPVVVHTYHGHLLNGYFASGGARVVRSSEAALARVTSRLIAIGHGVQLELLGAGIGEEEQYTVMSPGVAPPRRITRAAARAGFGLKEDDFVVAFVGRLSQIKRPDRVLQVAQRVCAMEGNAVFLVVGEGPLLDEVSEWATRLGDRLRLLGWRADTDGVYSAADVALLASDNEGMPVSLIEAAMCGVPAVATDVGSVGEVVVDGETGVLCRKSVSELSNAVLSLRDGKKRESFGQAAQVYAQGRFSLERFASETACVYDALLHSP